jgi:hypothetical protein
MGNDVMDSCTGSHFRNVSPFLLWLWRRFLDDFSCSLLLYSTLTLLAGEVLVRYDIFVE